MSKKTVKTEVETVEAKHIFIDIVSYTNNRSVEAQSDVIATLNKIVLDSLKEHGIIDNERILIPTGDGMCISLLNIFKPYDIHLKIALLILKKLHEYNNKTDDDMRNFQIRVGISENTDNLITDINKNKNIAGKGINFASRIEGLCDGNQILVGESVFDRLSQRELYMKSFVSHDAEVKHSTNLKVHQYVNKELDYLNSEVPSLFKKEEKPEKKLTEFEAYYMNICLNNEKFIERNSGHAQHSSSLSVLLFQLTEDIIEKKNVSKANPLKPTQKIKGSNQEYFDYLQSVEFWVIADLSKYYKKQLNISKYFLDVNYLFLNDLGKEKLNEEFPNIQKSFNK